MLNPYDGSWGLLPPSTMSLGKTNFNNGLDLVSKLIKVEEQKALEIEAKSHPKWVHLRTPLRAACSCRRMFYTVHL